MINLDDKIQYLLGSDSRLYEALKALVNQSKNTDSDLKELKERAKKLELYSHYVRVKAVANQSIPNNTVQPINFDTVEFDNGPFWNSAEPSKLSIREAGFYIVGGAIQIEPSLNPFYACLINRIDNFAVTTTKARSRLEILGTPANNIALDPPATLVQMFPGEYLTLNGFQTSGGPLNSVASMEFPYFWLGKLPLDPNQQVFRT